MLLEMTMSGIHSLINDLCTKPADTHQYLHQYSCHPWHFKRTSGSSQALAKNLFQTNRLLTTYRRIKGIHGLKGLWWKQSTKTNKLSYQTWRESNSQHHRKETKQFTPLVVMFYSDLPCLTCTSMTIDASLTHHHDWKVHNKNTPYWMLLPS